MNFAAGPRLLLIAFRSEMAFGCCMLVAVAITLFAVDFPQNLPGAGLAAIALVIVRVDWRARIIPNWANLAAAALALIEAGMSDEIQFAILEAFGRGGALLLLFLVFRWAFRFWRGREGMGLGDVKLAGVLGLWLDWPYIPIAIELACLSAIACVLAPRLVSGKRLDGTTKIPFGAFLAPTLWLTWLSAKLLS